MSITSPTSPRPKPTPPSVERQRIMKRRTMSKLTEEELWAYPDSALPITGHLLEDKVFNPLAGIAVEESICRVIAKHIPEASIIVIVEDSSHDSPHGHIQYILDKEQHVLADGGSDEWHDLPWTGEVNDLAWDLHFLASPLFTARRGYPHMDLIVKA